ncbi:MAG: hypothetical protein ACFHHU_01630 [Porticoccaceae bacterium]
MYNYDEEGVVLWDFPMNFEPGETCRSPLPPPLRNLAISVSCLRCAAKYKGKKCHARRGVLVVLANRPPIPELAHRNIREFHIDDYVPPALQFEEPVAPTEDPVHLDVSHTQSIQPVSKRRPKVSEQTEPEAKPGGPAPKRSRTTKTPHTPAQDVFNLESRGNELVGGASQPNIELEGGEADPERRLEEKARCRRRRRHPREGGAAHAKDIELFLLAWKRSEHTTPRVKYLLRPQRLANMQ